MSAETKELVACLRECMAEIDSEIEQRKFSGNDEDWAALQLLYERSQSAIAALSLAAAAERIVAAAVSVEGVTISLPQPARHGQVLACGVRCLNIQPGSEVQGFLTSNGRFVNRIEARYLAHRAGQNPGSTGGRDNPELFSEDLW
jgi:hypothetical protein